MSPSFALPAINFFMADVGGGLGAFLSTWLAQVAHWNPQQIGFIIAAGSLTGAVLAAPAGALVDRVARLRLLLAASCITIVAGTLLFLPARAFLLVLAAQVIVSAGGALGAPSVSGLSLAVVGRKGFPRQQGTNEAANHAGNVVAAGVIATLAWALGPVRGPMAPIVVLALMATSTLLVLRLMDGSAIDPDRMRGRGPREKAEKRGVTREMFKNPRLLRLLAVVGLFQLANSAMLPLLTQRIVAEGSGNATSWTSTCIIMAQLTMVPVALLAGRISDRVGRRWLLLTACGVVIARCVVAMFAHGNFWLIPIEVLDGIAAAFFSVSAPVAVTDLTYGSGRTQTALGGMGTMQAGGAALASVAWGFVTKQFGYGTTFAGMAAFAAAAVAVLLTFHLRDEEPPAKQREANADQPENAAAMSATV